MSKKPTGCQRCGRCCGFVLCHEHEYDQIAKYAKDHGLTPLRQGTTCPWYQNKACIVYPVRPFCCVMFGRVPAMPCPHAIHRQIDPAKQARREAQYGRYAGISRCLHEAAYTQAEIIAITHGWLGVKSLKTDIAPKTDD